jgi:hypothetical protein
MTGMSTTTPPARLRVTVHLIDRAAALGAASLTFADVDAVEVVGAAAGDSYDGTDVGDGGRVLVVNAGAVVAVTIEREPEPAPAP